MAAPGGATDCVALEPAGCGGRADGSDVLGQWNRAVAARVYVRAAVHDSTPDAARAAPAAARAPASWRSGVGGAAALALQPTDAGLAADLRCPADRSTGFWVRHSASIQRRRYAVRAAAWPAAVDSSAIRRRFQSAIAVATQSLPDDCPHQRAAGLFSV